MRCTRRRRRWAGKPVESRASPPGWTGQDGRGRPSLHYLVQGWPQPYNKGMTDSLIVAGRQFHSRLIVGTGKYKSFQETARALEASGAEMVTVAVRRVNLDRSKESLLDYID